MRESGFTEEESALLARATSVKGYRYFGSGRFFILAGQTFADTMLELLEQESG